MKIKILAAAIGLVLLPFSITSAQACPEIRSFLIDSEIAERDSFQTSSTLQCGVHAAPLINGLSYTPKEISLPEPVGCSWNSPLLQAFLRLFPDYRIVSNEPRKGTNLHMVFIKPPYDEFVLNGQESEALCSSCLSTPKIITLVITTGLTVNAFALPRGSIGMEPAAIVVTQGLLEHMESEGEAAFILAHEMAHILKDHFTPEVPLALLSHKQKEQISQIRHLWELEADHSAMRRLRHAGYDSIAGVTLLNRLSSAIASEDASGESDASPGLQQRISALHHAINEANLPTTQPITGLAVVN